MPRRRTSARTITIAEAGQYGTRLGFVCMLAADNDWFLDGVWFGETLDGGIKVYSI